MPNVKISCDQEVLTVIRSQRRLCHVYLGALIKGSPGKFLTCSSWIKTVQNLTFITQRQRELCRSQRLPSSYLLFWAAQTVVNLSDEFFKINPVGIWC